MTATQTNLTAKQADVLNAFNVYDSVESTVSDLGVSWTDVNMLATGTGYSVKSVKGIVGSLVKKGLVQTDADDEGKPGSALCLTEDGAYKVFALRLEAEQPEQPEGEAPADEAPAEAPKAMKAGTKKEQALKLVSRKNGATKEAIAEALEITPVAAASLVGDLRRAGHKVVGSKTDKGYVYHAG